jgi:4-hydroxy-4-methyl-2-oxoglutarate aldolase
MTEFAPFSPTTLADVLPRTQVMSASIRPLWPDAGRIAGPAFTVECGAGDNLMLHAAIYHAPPGSIIVAAAADAEWALAGGNVCAVAQKHGIAGFVLDGAIRDVAETRRRGFPVFARAIIPKSAAKEGVGSINRPIVCGGVRISPGDIVVADEEGIVVVPSGERESVIAAAREREATEAAHTLESWEADHQKRVFELLAKKGLIV